MLIIWKINLFGELNLTISQVPSIIFSNTSHMPHANFIHNTVTAFKATINIKIYGMLQCEKFCTAVAKQIILVMTTWSLYLLKSYQWPCAKLCVTRFFFFLLLSQLKLLMVKIHVTLAITMRQSNVTLQSVLNINIQYCSNHHPSSQQG